jgi:UDPglucose 6-dehydrogenase
LKIAVIGLGKIGLPLAALFAQNNQVIGIDTNTERVNTINNNHYKFTEPGLNELLKTSRKNLEATTDYRRVTEAEDTFIILPSPSKPDGMFTSEYVAKACKSIEPHFTSKYHLITVISTLMPGEMDNTIVPIFKNRQNIGICYSPTFLAIGNVIKGLTNPDAVAIGQADIKAGSKLETLWRDIIVNLPEIVHMNYINAELSKLLLNCFVTTKISIANTCAEICEQFKGGNSDIVMSFLGLDKRIGNKAIKAGLGYGGTCFPRDSKALIALATSQGLNSLVQSATDRFNNTHDTNVIVKILNLTANNIKNRVIAVLGLAYKTDVDLVDDSNALGIVKRLTFLGIKVKAYDPKAMQAAQNEFQHQNLTYCNDIPSCIEDTDLCVVAVPWEEFKGITAEQFKAANVNKILDCWRIYNKQVIQAHGVEYHAIGLADD